MPDGDYVGFLPRYGKVELTEGDFVDKTGRVLGRHRGLVAYTTGQRKGHSATQDRRGLQSVSPKTQGLADSKARLADRGCVRLDGAKRKKSVCSRAEEGI